MRLWFCIFTWQDLRRFFSKFRFLRFFFNFFRRIFWDCFSQNWSPFVITIKLCNFSKFSKLFKNSGSFFYLLVRFSQIFSTMSWSWNFSAWVKSFIIFSNKTFFTYLQFSHRERIRKKNLYTLLIIKEIFEFERWF